MLKRFSMKNGGKSFRFQLIKKEKKKTVLFFYVICVISYTLTNQW
jgi:hypothetical protein